ncbi:unnamed protein product [Paramecium octaurelia]|uniref:Uncharacterized protein n=1 Tax=Paramecium octaurelia TaxID=43137 RepID=A0A8S1SQH5_PAROT|nr:unnamed protein product [Paramecium octaurelia]
MKCSFSKFSKELVFENKQGTRLIFSKNIPEKNMLKKAKDPDQFLQIEKRLQLLFDQYKTEKVLQQDLSILQQSSKL